MDWFYLAVYGKVQRIRTYLTTKRKSLTLLLCELKWYGISLCSANDNLFELNQWWNSKNKFDCSVSFKLHDTNVCHYFSNNYSRIILKKKKCKQTVWWRQIFCWMDLLKFYLTNFNGMWFAAIAYNMPYSSKRCSLISASWYSYILLRAMNIYVNGLEFKVRFLCSHSNAIVIVGFFLTAEGYFKHNPFKIMHFFLLSNMFVVIVVFSRHVHHMFECISILLPYLVRTIVVSGIISYLIIKKCESYSILVSLKIQIRI